MNGMKFDGGKPRMELLPPDAIRQLAWVLTYGAEKYEPQNWQKVPDGKTRYVGSLLRHVLSHMGGELLDPENGLPHLAEAGTCVLFLLHLLRDELPATYDFRDVAAKWAAERAKAKGDPLEKELAPLPTREPNRWITPCSSCGSTEVGVDRVIGDKKAPICVTCYFKTHVKS